MVKGDDYTTSFVVTGMNPGALRFLLHELEITAVVSSNHGTVTVHQDDAGTLARLLNANQVEWSYVK